MSRGTYEIKFNDEKIKIQKILAALMEMSKEMDKNSKKLIKELNWTPKDQINPPKFDVEIPIFEAIIPDELTKDVGVTKEVMRISPVDDKTIQIVITDASLPPEKCQEIAIQFTQQLYKKATGKTLRREQILIKNIANLEENICEYCLKPLEDLPHTCKQCGRTFCYNHRRPETHGCQPTTKIEFQEEKVLKKQKNYTSKELNKPKATLQKLPCG